MSLRDVTTNEIFERMIPLFHKGIEVNVGMYREFEVFTHLTYSQGLVK